MPTFIDRNPLPAVLFCGSVLSSLSELRDYVEYGVPTLIIEDASTLCATLKGCFTLYESVAFEHDRFMDWLDHELRSLARHDGDIDEAKKNICRILSLSIGEQPLIAFISKSDLENLPEKLLDLFAKSARDPGVLRRVLHLAVKLDIANIIRTIDIKSIFERQQISHIVERALTGDGKINALSALLDQNVAPHVSPSMLMRWHRRTTDKYFFNAIVLGHCLGREPIYEMIDENLVCQLNELLHRLSGGIGELLPPDFLFSQSTTQQNRGDAITILAVWALLLNRTELALCLCAYVPHPIAFSLVLAKTARGLAHETPANIGKQWRQRKLMDLLNGSEECCFKLSNEGIPLNPSGRTGLAGRGNYPKFGPNVLYISVIVWDDPSGTIKILTTTAGDLPQEWHKRTTNPSNFLIDVVRMAGGNSSLDVN